MLGAERCSEQVEQVVVRGRPAQAQQQLSPAASERRGSRTRRKAREMASTRTTSVDTTSAQILSSLDMSSAVQRTAGSRSIDGRAANEEIERRQPLREAAGELVTDPRAFRLSYPPVYAAVGAYRLLTDWSLFWAVWKKCKHGAIRGLAVGGGWVFLSAKAQLAVIRRFGQYLPIVKKYNTEHVVLGQTISVATYATTFILSAQFYCACKCAQPAGQARS